MSASVTTPRSHPVVARAVVARAVVARAAAVVAVPKAAPADSFVLHAPLELVARVGLLPFVAADRRADALGMIDWLRERYDAAGEPVAEPAPIRLGSPAEGATRLVAALAAGALDEVDVVAATLLPALTAPEAVGLLGEAVVASLAAAGHAPIGFALLCRVRPELPTVLLRGALRGIASRPDWKISWHLDAADGGATDGLYRAIRSTPQLGRPGSDFIHPLMSQVQDSGLTAQLLAPVLADRFDVSATGHVLTRVAAWSMLHDDPAQAPYGWTHALTMPQGVMALAGAGVHPRTALAVAGTFTVGFRAAHATVHLPELLEPGQPADATVEELVTAAALHEDAHVVKFALATLHAAADDPAFRPLYLRSLQRLVEWWRA